MDYKQIEEQISNQRQAARAAEFNNMPNTQKILLDGADTLQSLLDRNRLLEDVAEAAEKMAGVYTGDDRPRYLQQALARLETTDQEPQE